VFKREFGDRVEKVNAEVQKRWQAHVPQGIPLLQGIQPPNLSPQLKEAVEFARLNNLAEAAMTDELSRVGSGTGLVAGGALAAAVALATGKSAVAVLGVTLFSSTQPWMWPVVAFGALAVLFGMKKFGTSKEDLERQIADALDKQWGQLQQGLKGQIEDAGAGVRRFYRKQFETNVIPSPRARFVERKAEADRDFEQSQAHREAVAAKARQLRQGQIEPLRTKLEAFSAACNAKFQAASPQTTSPK
jgi:hypothetical protein